MDTTPPSTIALTNQGVSLLFQQGVAFIVLCLAIILLSGALIYVFRLYNQSMKDKDLLIEKYYLAALKQTEVLAAFTESLRDVIRHKS
jgi:uncharacterized SAM-binding protein YcdF (DUF218 family)